MKQNRSRERIALVSDLAQIISVVLSLVSIGLLVLASAKPDFAKDMRWPPVMWALLGGFFLALAIALQLRRRFRVKHSRRQHSLAQRAATGYMRVGALSEAKKLQLDKVFVPPRLRMIDRSTLRPLDGREYSPKRVLRYARSEEQEGVVFTGVAGSGKSVLAQWLVHSLAVLEAPDEWAFLMRSLPEKERTGRVAELRERWKRFLERLQLRPEAWELHYPYPFFVELWEGALMSGEPSAELVMDLLSQGDDRSQIRQMAQDGLILPVFDGLDQLSGESQRLFWESLRVFVRKYQRNGPFVLTMRDYGAVNVDPSMADIGYSLWHIQPFNERQVRRYVQRYFSARDSNEADASERLWKAIEATAETAPQIWQWLTEPLLMALITNAFDPVVPTPLPRDRINLFDAYLRDMRTRQRRSPATRNLNSQQREVDFSPILEETAFHAMEWAQTELVDAKRRLGQYAGVLTRPSELRPEFYRFTHLSLQTYFAARHLSGQLRRNSPDLAHGWWEKSVLRALPSGRNGSTPGIEERDNWQSNWRELLTLTAGMLTPSSSSVAASGSIVWQETPIYHKAVWIADVFPAPLSTILSLRLMHAMQERGAVIDTLIDQEQIIAVLLDALPTLRPSWSRDVWELSFLLNDVGWARLRQLAFAPDTNRQMVPLLGALRHRRAAEILLDLVCEQRRLAPETAQAMEGMGMVAVRPIVAAFRRVKDRSPRDLELQAILIELMGYTGSAREFGAILSGSRHSEGIVFGRDVPDELVQASYEALARWGSDGSQTLLTCLRRAHKLSTRLKDSLVEALSQADLDDEIDALMVYLHKDSVQKQMVVRVIANKLDNAPNSADVFVQFMNQERTRFNRVSHSLWRDILKALEKRRLMHSRSSWQHKGYTTLYEWLRSLNLPSANYLRALLEICGCTDAELAGRWIEDALQDTLFEVREEALNAFVQRSRRSANHCSWLNQSRHELPSYVVQELEYRLGKAQLLRDQATASVSASSVVVTP